MDYFTAYNEVLAQAQAEGVELSDQELQDRVLIVMEQSRPADAEGSVDMTSHSSLDGAPSDDIGIDLGLTPPGYMQDLETRTGQLQAGGASNPLPMTDEYSLDGDILQYEPGMTQEEYDAAKANQRYRVGMIRGMLGDGGYGSQVHSQQDLDLGTADDMEKWDEYVASDPALMQRYDPAGFAAMQAEQEAEFAREHADGLADKYGTEAAYAWLRDRQEGNPVNYRNLRTDSEELSVRQRENDAIMARGGTDAVPLVLVDENGNELTLEQTEALAENPEAFEERRQASMAFYRNRMRGQESRSGYSGAMGGSAVSQMPAVGEGPDGETETNAERFARKTRERKDAEASRRRRVSTNAMLAGPNPGRNMTNAFDMMGNPGDFGLTPNQQRALQYMLPGGQLAAEVDASNMRTATDLATAGLRNTLVPLLASGLQGGAGGDDPVPFSNAWRSSPQQQERLKKMADTYGDDSVSSRGDMVSLLEAEGMDPGQAQLATDWAFDNTWQGYTQ